MVINHICSSKNKRLVWSKMLFLSRANYPKELFLTSSFFYIKWKMSRFLMNHHMYVIVSMIKKCSKYKRYMTSISRPDRIRSKIENFIFEQVLASTGTCGLRYKNSQALYQRNVCTVLIRCSCTGVSKVMFIKIHI